MDSNMKDESRIRRREEALARRLGEALDRGDTHGGKACPDAEAIAAYHGQELGPEEAARCESHFAECSRCRKILAVLTASDDTPLAETEVARLGELVAGARAPRGAASQTVQTIRPIRLDWRGRGLAPALGVAAVLVVWFAVRPPWRTTDRGSSGSLIAQAPKNEAAPNAEPPTLDRLSKADSTKKQEADSRAVSAAPKDLSVSKTESPKQVPESLAKNRLADGGTVGGPVPSAGVADNVSEVQKKERTETAVTTAGELAAPPPLPAAPPAPLPSLEAEVQAKARTAPTETGAAANAPARAPVASSAKAAAPGKSAAADQNLMPLSGFSAVTIAASLKSPSGMVTWRIGENGRIERSTDGGGKWVAQAGPSQQKWVTGAAVSDTTCWIVGRDGAIARTTDGEHWAQIAPPPMASATTGKLPDWTGITASSAQAATITASDQRRYATQDGGKTWQAE